MKQTKKYGKYRAGISIVVSCIAAIVFAAIGTAQVASQQKQVAVADQDVDQDKDITGFLDFKTAKRHGLETRRVSVDFPEWMIKMLEIVNWLTTRILRSFEPFEPDSLFLKDVIGL